MTKRIVVLGGSGMLGSMITSCFAEMPDFDLAATVRTERLRSICKERLPRVQWKIFDAEAATGDMTAVLDGCEWVINAIGITKPLIKDDDPVAIERAVRVNAILPHRIACHATQQGQRVLQIATDCVFSGVRGHYCETDPHDALDVYGKTKSLGEVYGESIHHLRCSIIGPEPKEHKFLLDWFLGQPSHSSVNGYSNHLWNGVTTLHFAKLCHGIITRNISMPHLQHVFPGDMVTKCELLGSFAKSFQRQDVTITPTEAAVVVDRTLGTTNEALNRELWAAAGYPAPPSVLQMVAELARYGYEYQLEGG